MAEAEEIARLIGKVRFRLGQAHNIARAAETCAAEDCRERVFRLLEELQGLAREVGHLV